MSIDIDISAEIVFVCVQVILNHFCLTLSLSNLLANTLSSWTSRKEEESKVISKKKTGDDVFVIYKNIASLKWCQILGVGKKTHIKKKLVRK